MSHPTIASTVSQASAQSYGANGGRAIAFIDGAIANPQELLQGLQSGVEVVVLDANLDGISQITTALQGRTDIDSLHIFSHGEAGALQLGNSRLSQDTLTNYSNQLQQWSRSLSGAADLMLYGCKVGTGSQGSSLIKTLAELTGADVAASNDLTGRGGNWVLETQTGSIEAEAVLSAPAMANYSGTLNVITVTNASNSGEGSLRWAVGVATPGSTIRFDASLANQTITLTTGEISIPVSKNLVIDATGVDNLRISGNNQSRIFYLNSTSVQPTSLTVRNLTFVNGATNEHGGAIRTTHQGVLNIENSRFLNNRADQGGGAIFSAFEGTMTVTNSWFEGNVATAGNNERGAGAIAFWGPRALTVRNSDFINNRGINGGAINSLNGKLTIEDSRFFGNNTTAAFFDTGKANPFLRGYGGAVYTDRASSTSEPSGQIRISRSVFENNQGRGEGGAAYLYTGRQDRVIINRSSFRNNEVLGLPNGGDGNGGGVVVMSNETNQGLTINRSSFINNRAGNQGGGLWAMKAPATITNTTFSGNRTAATPGDSDQNGGGLALYGPATITNSTIAFNTAGWVGGGILADNSPIAVRNTIFFQNTAANGGNNWKIRQDTSRALTDLGGNVQFPDLQSSQSNRFNDNRATNSIRVADPRMGPLQNDGGFLWYHPLLPTGNSAVINLAVPGAPSDDIRQTVRDVTPDVGAFEIISGGPANETLIGRVGTDSIIGRRGDDIIIGGMGADYLAGGQGNDRFTYRGASQQEAFSQSTLNSMDQLMIFNAVQGDRIQLDYDNNFSTSELPNSFTNAGGVAGNNVSEALLNAFADKDWQAAGAQSLGANEAVVLFWNNQAFLAVNDSNPAFQANRDLVINVTGMTIFPEHFSTSVYPVSSYFV